MLGLATIYFYALVKKQESIEFADRSWSPALCFSNKALPIGWLRGGLAINYCCIVFTINSNYYYLF
jgi:hypothetical protein